MRQFMRFGTICTIWSVKVTLFHGYFSRFLNRTNGSKSHKVSNIVFISVTWTHSVHQYSVFIAGLEKAFSCWEIHERCRRRHSLIRTSKLLSIGSVLIFWNFSYNSFQSCSKSLHHILSFLSVVSTLVVSATRRSRDIEILLCLSTHVQKSFI